MSDSTYARIDHAVFRMERAIVVVSLVVMAVVVFLDVVHRGFSGEDSKLAEVVARIAGWLGSEITKDTPAYESLEASSPWILFVGFSALSYFGIRSAKRAVPVPPPLALGAAVAGVLVSYGLVRLMLVLLPNGLVWSQPLALVLTLWVGFIGASMCTYENRHLRVEAVQRFLPERIRPYVAFVSGLLTTAVCLGLLWVSLRYVLFNYEEYVGTEGKGGMFQGMDMPKYIGFSALPVAFGFMAVRFFVKSLAALRGELGEPVDPVLAAGGMPELDDPLGDRRPSEVATEALSISRPGERRPSAVDTMTSKSEMIASRLPPPSRIPTDAHEIISAASGVLGAEDSGVNVSPDLVETRKLEEGPIRFVEDSDDGEEGPR
ncbi:MAG: TRAP transporter small permease [Myxococcales bacterium]|nr:TRAP transporter small permease [Myxococcales bacterium]MCB9718120.1 TRAP transporter small permease [Myxococcales bacterium]